MTDIRVLIAVLLSGLLTGSELTSWGVVHPVLWKLDYAAQVKAEKLMYRRFASVDPFLMVGTIIAGYTAAGALNGAPARLAFAGAASYTLMLGITLVGNMPINLRIFRWDEKTGNPDDWRRLRRRWDAIHALRIVLDGAGFVLVTVAALGW